MSKAAYVGVSNVACKIKKGYVGIDNAARALKKGYVGIGNVARPFFSSSGVSYYGPAEGLRSNKKYLAGAATDAHVLFASGKQTTISGNSATISNNWEVDAYDVNLVRVTATDLPFTINDDGPNRGNYSVSTEDYAIFTDCTDVCAYNKNLVQITPTALTTHRPNAGLTRAGDNIVIAGGGGDSTSIKSAEAYNGNLVKVSVDDLSSSRGYLTATSVSNTALFAGGGTGGVSDNSVDTYSASLVHGTAEDLDTTYTTKMSAAVATPMHALFHNATNYMCVYDANLTRLSTIQVPFSSITVSAASNGYYVLVIGISQSLSMCIINPSLITQVMYNATESYHEYAGIGAIGPYILVAGGYYTGYESRTNNVVDVFLIQNEEE